MSNTTIKVDMYPHEDVARLQSELAAARDEAEKAQAKADNCGREARQWRQEARTQSSIVAEIYEAVTGKKGEPGDWNGANPVKAEFERLRGRVSEITECLKEARANMEDWAAYVPEYFQEKHGLAEDLAAIDRVLAGQQPASTPE